MNTDQLVFSPALKYRLLRHGLFCLSVFIYSLTRIGIMYPPEIFWNVIPAYLGFTFHWTIVILCICYGIVYFLVPKFFLRKKYGLFAVMVILYITVVQLLNMIWVYFQSNTFSSIVGIDLSSFFSTLYPSGVIRILGNPVLVCCLLLSLKSLKNWQIKRMENEMLSRANTNAELQLLKSQIHPHFLFNTLNNIYSYSLSNPKAAAQLVNKLKNTVHYMIDECNQQYVPLKNEMLMISNYLELEKIRYGSRLSMQVELMNSEKNYLVAPLLMIPFVENSFKHGLSQMLEHPWIVLKIHTDGNTLKFFLSNSKPPALMEETSRKGIGLNNVKKRLELLYPGKHLLRIVSEKESFTITMEIQITENLAGNPITDDHSKPLFKPILQYDTQ